jgi:hypothetical protein
MIASHCSAGTSAARWRMIVFKPNQQTIADCEAACDVESHSYSF